MRNDLIVLYAEDDTILRESFTEIFQEYFFKVITADNGSTALELYEKYKPDIVILDISIPHISGLNVASKIRERDKEVEIIMLTAYTDQDKLLQAVNLQLFAYLVKPVQKKELDLTLNNLFIKYQKNDTLSLAYNFKWNKSKEELFYKDINIELTNKERLIIAFLCKHTKQYFKACDLALDVFEENIVDKDCNNIVQLLSRFKSKIYKQFDINDFFIENSYGAGYKIKQ